MVCQIDSTHSAVIPCEKGTGIPPWGKWAQFYQSILCLTSHISHNRIRILFKYVFNLLFLGFYDDHILGQFTGINFINFKHVNVLAVGSKK